MSVRTLDHVNLATGDRFYLVTRNGEPPQLVRETIVDARVNRMERFLRPLLREDELRQVAEIIRETPPA